MRLCHCYFAHTSNAWIIQVSKLVDQIKLSDAVIRNFNNDQFSLDSETDDGEKNEPNIDKYIILALFNKIMKNIADFYDMCIKNKYTIIIKHKAMTPIVQKLEEIYINL